MLDARTNVFTGARMLADLTRRYGGIDIALAAWNAGEGTVRKAGGQMPDIAETEAHVHMVLELYWALLQRKLPQPRARRGSGVLHAGRLRPLSRLRACAAACSPSRRCTRKSLRSRGVGRGAACPRAPTMTRLRAGLARRGARAR